MHYIDIFCTALVCYKEGMQITFCRYVMCR